MTNKERAILVAEKAHANQNYDKIYSYIYHIKCVVDVAEYLNYGETIVIACTLHDVLEDSDLSYNDIKNAFSEEIAEIVYCVTDEAGRNRKERKEKTYPKIRNNWKAIVVKICDRIANVQHSKKYNQKMFEMYKNEHTDFLKELFFDEYDSKTNRAWKLLNDVMFS